MPDFWTSPWFAVDIAALFFAVCAFIAGVFVEIVDLIIRLAGGRK